MKPDLDYLRRHYESLNNEALLAVNRGDLVEAAQTLYDAELRKRGLGRDKNVRRNPAPSAASEDLENEFGDFGENEDGAPDWLEEAAEAYSVYMPVGAQMNDGLSDATDALEAEGIPCHVDIQDEPEHKVQASTKMRLLVPAELSMHATSTIERDLSNPEFENVWKAYLESLSDEDFRRLKPEVVLCGLFDRVKRVTDAYEAESARRLSRGNF